MPLKRAFDSHTVLSVADGFVFSCTVHQERLAKATQFPGPNNHCFPHTSPTSEPEPWHWLKWPPVCAPPHPTQHRRWGLDVHPARQGVSFHSPTGPFPGAAVLDQVRDREPDVWILATAG